VLDEAIAVVYDGKRPGFFKEAVNRTGDSVFVLPGLMAETLRTGWDLVGELDTAFERAVYVMFLISEVHPFDDGNGRVARVMMNGRALLPNEVSPGRHEMRR
jgi:hypothetical protein